MESLAAGGRGVARHEGKVWFVEGAFPGDRVEAEVLADRKRYVEARAVRVLEPSSDRRTAPCPLQEQCGGCPWMPLDEAAQRSWKRRIVLDALERVGGLGGVEVAEVVPSPSDLGYRGKVEFTVESGRVGLRERGRGGEVVDVERCLMLDEAGNQALAAARGFLQDRSRVPVESVLRVVVRRSRARGETLVALRAHEADLPWAGAFARHVAGACSDVRGVVRIRSRRAGRGRASTELLAGRDWLEESLGGIDFRVPAQAFFQVNPAAAEAIVARVREAAVPSGGGNVLDLYGGVGIYGLVLGRDGARATVCEADEGAVLRGSELARSMGVDVRYVRADARRFLERVRDRGERVDTVVANPPRGGFGRGVAEALAAVQPDRIVLVSCDPATLARDLAALAGREFAVGSVAPIDLFPQTAHVETVSRLDRR